MDGSTLFKTAIMDNIIFIVYYFNLLVNSLVREAKKAVPFYCSLTFKSQNRLLLEQILKLGKGKINCNRTRHIKIKEKTNKPMLGLD